VQKLRYTSGSRSGLLAVEKNVQQVLAEPSIQERIRGVGVEPAVNISSAEASKWLATERDKWSKVIRERGIQAE